MSRSTPQWVGLGLGAVMVATIVAGAIMLHWPGEPRVAIGRHDEIYYYRRATADDARALGKALQGTGFFNDRGTSVLLWMGGGPTVVSFIVGDGAWNRPHAISNFTEIGRRIATSVGGFPIEVQLVDAHRVVRRKMNVGKLMVGAKDMVYYFGAATEQDAKALAGALQSEGYFSGKGATVALLKGEGTAISFVVQEGLWNDPAVTATLEHLVRRVAASASGLPVELRLLDRNMAIRQAVRVE
ncbi:MAG TPA: hypothetical protein VHW09_28210 [Bryobacteraceae bacterium]|jgi:hypothetical protein|nr:hypothetical protein [Bryobacteraceae bacterium]